jgi:nucleotide-binding universal stress UspA family protein
MAPAYRSILVAYDGSSNADRALDHAIALAHDEHARLTLVAVMPPAAGGSPFAPMPGDQASWIREGFESSLRRAAARVPDDISVTTRVLEGAPAKRIVDCVRAGGHDLVVMGSHARGRLAGALIGSVSQQVVHHSQVPVLVCHAERSAA